MCVSGGGWGFEAYFKEFYYGSIISLNFPGGGFSCSAILARWDRIVHYILPYYNS